MPEMGIGGGMTRPESTSDTAEIPDASEKSSSPSLSPDAGMATIAKTIAKPNTAETKMLASLQVSIVVISWVDWRTKLLND